MPHAALLATLAPLISLETSDREMLTTLFRHKTGRRGTDLLTTGQVAGSIYFINSGYLRIYLLPDGEEITRHLAGPGQFVTSFASFLNEEKAAEAIGCVTDVELLQIRKADLYFLYRQGAKWEAMGRLLMEQALLDKEQRTADFILYSAEERYARLLEHQPELVQNVQIQYLASYLGIQPESLSRIRKRLIS